MGALVLFSSSPGYANGKTLFVERCGACHGTGKEAVVVNPAQFAAVQWGNWFRRQKHQRVRDISSNVTPEEVRDIVAYLQDHAADSDHPEVAAIP